MSIPSPQGGGRGYTYTTCCQYGQCYTFPKRLEVETFDDVITSIFLVFHRHAVILFDPSSTFLYTSTYFADEFDILSDCMLCLFIFLH